MQSSVSDLGVLFWKNAVSHIIPTTEDRHHGIFEIFCEGYGFVVVVRDSACL